MSDLSSVKDQLVNDILKQIIDNIDVSVDDICIDSEEISEALQECIVEVLKEEETRKIVKDKIRKIINNIDEKEVAKSLQPNLGPGFFKRLFKL